MEGSSLPRWVAVLFVLAFALVGYLIYANYQERQETRKNQDDATTRAQAMAAELDKTNSRIADVKGQLDVMSQKLGLTEDELARSRGLAQTLRKEQQQSDAQLREQIGAVQSDTTTKFGQVATDINGAKTDISRHESRSRSHQEQAAEHRGRPRSPERIDRDQP